jgi:hypothetical protein
MLVASSETDLAYIKSHIECEAEFEERIFEDWTFKKPINASLFADKNLDIIVIVSYYGYKKIMHEFSINGIKSISMYEYFIENGLLLEHNYYDFIMSKYATVSERTAKNTSSFNFKYFSGYYEIYCEKKIQYLSKNNVLKEFYLKRIIFMCLYIKDFVYAKKYIDEYVLEKYSCSDELMAAWTEIEELLMRIKNALLNKNAKDAIMFWVDGINNKEAKKIPFLNNLEKNSVSFEKAYTAAPWTSQVLKAIMCGKYSVDDKSYLIENISSENSPFLRVLEKNGINFICCSFLKSYFDKHYASKENIDKCTATSMCFWSAISEILRHKKPTFILAHELANTHYPWISISNERERLDHNNSAQKEESLLYAGEQLEFYSSLLPENMIKIFMSDHSTGKYRHYYYFNVLLKLQGTGLKAKKVEKIFSYIKFHKLIEWLYNPSSILFEKLFSDYAEVQDVDYYNRRSMNLKLQHGIHEMFGIRAIITDNETYVIKNDGVELFYNNKFGKDAISLERLNKLRTMAGNYHIDPWSDKKFKNSQYVWMLKDNYFKRCGEFEQRKKQTIRTLFEKLKGKSVAVRTGELSTLYMLLLLHPDLNGVVKYVIDEDKSCMAGLFGGIKIISPEDIDNHNIDVIVIPSFGNACKNFKNELKAYKEKIVCLYEYLAENDVKCTINFFRYEISLCDFEYLLTFEMKQKIQRIRALFEELKGKTIALRTGGGASRRLLYLLRPDLNGSVKYIIDNKENCECSSFDWAKVIPLKEVENYEIDVIIMPSFGLRETLKEELNEYKTQTINLYEYLEEKGIKCTTDFYNYPDYFKIPIDAERE